MCMKDWLNSGHTLRNVCVASWVLRVIAILNLLVGFIGICVTFRGENPDQIDRPYRPYTNTDIYTNRRPYDYNDYNDYEGRTTKYPAFQNKEWLGHDTGNDYEGRTTKYPAFQNQEFRGHDTGNNYEGRTTKYPASQNQEFRGHDTGNDYNGRTTKYPAFQNKEWPGHDTGNNYNGRTTKYPAFQNKEWPGHDIGNDYEGRTTKYPAFQNQEWQGYERDRRRYNYPANNDNHGIYPYDYGYDDDFAFLYVYQEQVAYGLLLTIGVIALLHPLTMSCCCGANGGSVCVKKPEREVGRHCMYCIGYFWNLKLLITLFASIGGTMFYSWYWPGNGLYAYPKTFALFALAILSCFIMSIVNIYGICVFYKYGCCFVTRIRKARVGTRADQLDQAERLTATCYTTRHQTVDNVPLIPSMHSGNTRGGVGNPLFIRQDRYGTDEPLIDLRDDPYIRNDTRSDEPLLTPMRQSAIGDGMPSNQQQVGASVGAMHLATPPPPYRANGKGVEPQTAPASDTPRDDQLLY